MLKYVALVLIMGALGFAAIVRVRPLPPEIWHVMPSSVVTKGEAGRFTVTTGGDLDAMKVDLALDATIAALRERIEATSGTTLLAGNLDAGFATYVTRSKLWGFPDITNIQLTATETGTRVEMAARLVYGKADLGVNEKRVRQWLGAIKG